MSNKNILIKSAFSGLNYKEVFKKLKNPIHRHKFKTLSTRDYTTRGIMCDDNGSFLYTEKGKKIIKICKCGYSIYEKVDIIRKREGE